jgi:uncharacterized protein (DUF4415 family)
MNKKIVKHTVNLSNPASLTASQKAEIKTLAGLPDDKIDYSDIPPLTDEFWAKAVHNPFYKPTKTTTTMRVDSDVLAWLKSKGKGYQTRLNAILREAMLHEIKH